MARWGFLSVCGLALWASCSKSSPPGVGGTRQACYANGTCNSGLICLSNVCVAAPDGGAGATGTGGGSGAGGTGGATAGTSGGTDAAAGSTGGAGAAGGMAGADAAAGTSGGTDAAAGTAGADAALDTAHGDASGTAGAGGATCPYKASYGNVIIAANVMLAEEHITPAGAGQQQATDEADWTGVIRNASTPDQVSVQLVNGYPPFMTVIAPMSVDLATQNDLQTCGACVTLFIALDGQTTPAFLPAAQTFIASSGTLNVTTVPTFPATAASRITGSLSNAVFEHVSIDPATGVTTKIDDCQISVTSVAFDAPVTNK
jgi:hypothetical protein